MHAMNFRPVKRNIHGFSLVELMIVVLLTGIAVIAIYRGYTAISVSTDTQEQVIELQQNLRIGMYWLEKELRRAGMNEEEDENAGFRLKKEELSHDPPDPPLSPAHNYLSFTMDMGGGAAATPDQTWNPGDPGDSGLTDDDEWLTYKLVASPLPSPVPPAPWTNFFNLVRTDENNGNPDSPSDMILISNVDALNFVYLDEDGQDLDPDTSPNDPATGRSIITGNDLDRIHTVEVALVVRTTNEDFRYTNNDEYRNLQGSLIYQAPGDHFRRRLAAKKIKIRNAGL